MYSNILGTVFLCSLKAKHEKYFSKLETSMKRMSFNRYMQNSLLNERATYYGSEVFELKSDQKWYLLGFTI